jgi:hypothetical protein
MAQRHVLEHPPQQADQKPTAARDSAPKPASHRGLIISIALVLVLGAVGFTVWKIFFATAPIPENIVLLSGRIEGDDSAVSPKAGGRNLEIRFREGDRVNAGDIIAVKIAGQGMHLTMASHDVPGPPGGNRSTITTDDGAKAAKSMGCKSTPYSGLPRTTICSHLMTGGGRISQSR